MIEGKKKADKKRQSEKCAMLFIDLEAFIPQVTVLHVHQGQELLGG
jgi:hypothetical protein